MTDSWKLGATSQPEYEQARTTVAAARAAIESYVRAVAQDKNALELLVGAPVADDLLPEGGSNWVRSSCRASPKGS